MLLSPRLFLMGRVSANYLTKSQRQIINLGWLV